MKLISMLAMPVMIFGIVLFGLLKKVKIYDCFVEGAREGLENTLQIVAPLIGLMVAVGMLRASGALDVLGKVLSPLTSLINMPSEVLPLALLRPVSGSGALAIVSDILKNCGPDSIQGKIASVMMGSTETTFYTVAVYFGSVGIKNLNYTLKAALLADLTGIVMATILTQMILG